jgi:Ni/Co efflux regulator RcnB
MGFALLLLGVASVPQSPAPEAETLPSPEQAVQRAWRLAQESGAYHFTTEIVQTTDPAPTLANVGRSSRRETLTIEGQTNLPERELLMTLRSGAGSALDRSDAVEVRVAGDRAYGRIAGETWEEMDNFSDAFAPANDLMAYLAGEKNVRRLGTELQEVPSPDGAQEIVRFTRYSFDMDGPAFASYLRDQLEDYLREAGELPAGLTLDVSDQFRAVTGEGEIWIDADDGLPRRMAVHLVYPQQRNGERVEADIQTDFYHLTRQLAQAPTFSEDPAGWMGRALGLPRALRDWQRVGQQAVLIAGSLGLLSIILASRRAKTVYVAVVAAVILSMVVAPLLQSQQVYAFSSRMAARRAEQEQSQKEADSARQIREEMTASEWDPQRDPLSVDSPQPPAASVPQPTLLDPQVSLPASHPWASGSQAVLQDTQSPDSDADGDG